jgi:hypothetical protein
MPEQYSTLTRHDLEGKIVKRCWQDEEFRREFTADPAGVFVKYLQVPAANLPKIVIHQETAGSWHIVLPPKPANADALSDQDLEKIAGGASTLVCVGITVTAATLGAAGSMSISASAMVSVDRGW